MTELESHIQLSRIREEVGAAVITARIALITSSDVTDIRNRLPICVEQLRQVRGAMVMVQLPGAVLLLDEMLQLIQALETGQIALPRPAVDAMIHALLQLPVYLEQIEQGGSDSPYTMQPLIDELRAARGASQLTREILFSPDLDAANLDPVATAAGKIGQLGALIKRLRPIYERALLEWMRQPAEQGYVQQLAVMMQALAKESSIPAVQQLFKVTEAVLCLLQDGELLAEKPLYQLLGKVNQQLKRLIDFGESDLQDNPPGELMRRLLYHIARTQGGGEKVDAIRKHYRLDQKLPSDERIAQARAKLNGPDRNSVQSALSALRSEMGLTRRVLEKLLREEVRQGDAWLQIINELNQFATTLEFLGLEVCAGRIRGQVEMLQEFADGQRMADEPQLLEIAKNLIMVESVLQGGAEETTLADEHAADNFMLVDGECRKLRRAACHEITSELNRVKAALGGGAPSDLQRKESLPALNSVHGALEMLELHEAARLIRVCHHYIDSADGNAHSLQQDQLKSVAALVTGVEFCLEAVAEGQIDAEQLLGDAQLLAVGLNEFITQSEQQTADKKDDGKDELVVASIVKASMSSAAVEAEPEAVPVDITESLPESEEDVLSREEEPVTGVSTAETLVDDVEETVVEEPAPKQVQLETQHPYVPQQDPVLLDIFATEARDHLGTTRAFVHTAEAADGTAEIDKILQRVLHTLHGSALTAGMADIAVLAGQLEHHVSRLREERLPAQAGLLQLLTDSCNSIEQVLIALPQSGADTPLADKQALLARINVLDEVLETPPESAVELTPQQQAEAELRQVFGDECDEILARYQQHLQQWIENPQDRSPVLALERELHTLKGSARAAGMGAIADISHVLESLLTEVSAGQAAGSGGLFELLNSAREQLLLMLERLKAGYIPEDCPDLIRQVREFVAGAKGILQQDGKERELEKTAPVERDGGQIVHFPQVGKELKEMEQISADKLAQMSQLLPEQFRVRADLMDNLANVSSEAGVYRSRIGQQVEGVKLNIEELHSTIERLRDQLRRLDIETESQMLSRYVDADEPGGEVFDPLELDQFSRKQTLARGIMESLNDLTSIEELLAEQNRQSESLLAQQGEATQELQDVLNRARLQPFSSYLPRLHRLVEQVCRELGKQVELHVEGANQELDRSMLARVLPSIEHILRNAIVHGIEAPSRRSRAGKPETGKISIQLERHGADMLIRIGDDGAGLDMERIRLKGIDAGYLHPSTPFTEEQAVQYIQRTGLSTADSVTQLAGRGVGLDVVKSEVRQLGGTLQIRSWQGEGMRFTLRLPLIRYLSSALLVSVDTETYALPPMGIEGITRIEGARISARKTDSEMDSYVECMGQSYRIEILAELVGAGRPHRYRDDRHYVVILLRVAEHRLAVVVDKVIGEREIMMKSFGPQLSRVGGVPGATFMDDGSAVMILDLAALIELGGSRYKVITQRPVTDETLQRKVLVVDDSITVRCVMAQFLERHGMQVLTAKDGIEAISVLEKQRPDVILLDVEMPRMNGYELARYIRNSTLLKEVPIIMITSRSGAKHRQKASALGVDLYLSKPYREDELLEHIQQLRPDLLVKQGV